MNRKSKAIILFPSAPLAMKTLQRLDIEISRPTSAAQLLELINTAAGLQRKWRPVREVADRAGELWVKGEAKLGEELEKLPEVRGGDQKSKIKSTKSELLIKPTRDALGIDKKLSARAKRIHELGERQRKRLIEELKAENKPINSVAVLSLQRKENKTEKKHQLATAAFSEDGPFDVVVIDPPWPMQKIDRDVRPNQDAFDYPVMTEEQLAAFWSKELEPKLKSDAHVFCWTTQRFLRPAIRLIEEAWGLRYMLLMVWHKPGGFQPIDLPQFNCEFVVYARKGSPLFIDTKDFPCCFEAPRREHSRKPNSFYETIRRVTGGSRIDVFAREEHDGFARFGNEVNKFGQKEAAE